MYKLNSFLQVNNYCFNFKDYWQILNKEVVAVCSENHSKHRSALCGRNAELCNGKEGGIYMIWQLSWQNAPVKLYVITDVPIVPVTCEYSASTAVHLVSKCFHSREHCWLPHSGMPLNVTRV